MIKLYDYEAEIIISALNVAIASKKKLASDCYDPEFGEFILEGLQSYEDMLAKLSERFRVRKSFDDCAE